MQSDVLSGRATALAAAPLTWRRGISNPTYSCMPALRAEMKRFLDLAGLPVTYTDKLCLSLSEVISNLVRHPPQKATRLDVTVETGAGGVRLDIADDSTPFATFDAICKTALARMRAAKSMAENGYGIGCVLVQHTCVTYTPASESADGRNHFTIDDRKETTNEKAAPSPPAKTPQRKPVIFLIDDDAGDLKAHHRMLSGFYDVVPLPDAASALSLFRVRRPDLVISDLHMPQMDGTALRRQISSLPDGDTVPFVFLSASSEGLNDRSILRLGIDDYLVKPVSGQSLERTAARVLGRHEQLGRAIEGRFHRDIQKYLHPSLPAAAGPWRITTLNRMAEVGGGDFTLHQQTPDGLLAVLADVMGHGLQAKFFAYAYAGYLRSLFRAAHNADAPTHTAAFLQQLSDAVIDDDFLDGTLLTCQSFHLGYTGDVRISSAGHPPPVLVQNGAAFALPVTGVMPGMAGHGRYEEYRRTLSRGDKIIFATDGFFDVFESDGGSSVSDTPTSPALLALLQTHGSRSDSAQLGKQLWRAFENYLGAYSRAVDDATLIIAAYEGEPA